MRISTKRDQMFAAIYATVIKGGGVLLISPSEATALRDMDSFRLRYPGLSLTEVEPLRFQSGGGVIKIQVIEAAYREPEPPTAEYWDILDDPFFQ